MVEHIEKGAHLLVGALSHATGGKPRWWKLPTEMSDMTKETMALAVDRGWMLHSGDSVCLTDAGRELVIKWPGQQS
jgi:hypothetical protein